MSDGNENRLHQIRTDQDRDGVSLGPIAIILTIGAGLIGFLTFPCVDLRVDYFLNGPDDSPMSVWQMRCEGEGLSCVCTQRADSMHGGSDCEVGPDLVVRCEKAPADRID